MFGVAQRLAIEASSRGMPREPYCGLTPDTEITRWESALVGPLGNERLRVRNRRVTYGRGRHLLALTDERFQNKAEIGWSLAQPPHEVGKPFATEWNVDADRMTRLSQS